MTPPRITPVLLTRNEAPNIGRTLERLTWADRVLILDSGSDDETRSIIAGFANVRIEERTFDSHAAQWEAAIRSPSVTTDWVLALDADYVLSSELVEELGKIDFESSLSGFRARFRYCIEGVPLRASLYPPLVVLFDRRRAHYRQDGHTQRLVVEGPIGDLKGRIFHDDRKNFSRFVEAQHRYARLEAEKIRATPFGELPPSGRLRKLGIVAPVLVPIWLLLGRGLILEGRRGLTYVRQRMVAEWMIARAMFASRKGTRP